jgi:hypothetical protein
MRRIPRKRAAVGIGRPLDALSGPWFVMPFNGRVCGLRRMSFGLKAIRSMLRRIAERAGGLRIHIPADQRS